MFRSGIMLRVGTTEEIERQFKEGYLRFGCAANWIMYAKSQPPGIPDRYEALGLLIAAKSIIRFGDKETAKTEYVLAGTLLSILIAVLAGMMVIGVLKP